MSKRSGHKPSSDVERDFSAALLRLVNGKPKHPDLKKLADQGRLKIGVSQVAKEAGRARTLIGFEGCKYSQIRDKILGFKRGETDAPLELKAEAVTRLRAQIAELRVQLQIARAWQVANFHECERAKKESERWKAQCARIQKNIKSTPDITKDNVTFLTKTKET